MTKNPKSSAAPSAAGAPAEFPEQAGSGETIARLASLALGLLSGSLSPAQALAATPGSPAQADPLWRALLHAPPAAWAAWPDGGALEMAYGGAFDAGHTLRYLARDPDNLAERVEGSTYTRWLEEAGQAVQIHLHLGDLACRLTLPAGSPPALRVACALRVRTMLGLGQPLAAFTRALGRHAVLGPLIRALPGIRVPQVPTLWEGLCWAIVGQQINLAFAYQLRNGLIALGHGLTPGNAGREAGETAPLPFPTPAQVLAIGESGWRAARFSRQKQSYLCEVAGKFAQGELDGSTLASLPPEEAAERLIAVRGLGPWSVNYALLRALGQMDALPVGDAGLKNALHRLFALATPPAPAEQAALMEPFRPYRGLATYYLWKSLDAGRQE